MIRINRTSVIAALAAVFFVHGGVAHAGVDDGMLGDQTDGANWAAIGRTYNENHYSPLAQITDRNIARLGLVWYYDLPPVTSVHTTPLAVDGVLYFAVGYSIVRAIDVKTGKLLWQYDPDVPSVAGDKLRAGWGSRGIAFWQDKVYVGTQDGRLIAINAKTGKPVWSVATTQSNDGRYITSAPRAFAGKVIIGHSGGDFEPTRGYVTAYEASTGKQLWRFYTIPGDPSKGFEDDTQAMAAKTWKGEWWKIGGGAAVWNAIAYDRETHRIYFGTGNGEPWNNKIRGAGFDNLFVSSLVAVDADTGKYVWHYQVNPGENWDYDATMDIEFTTLVIDGKQHRVLLNAPKNGFFYVIDRDTGALLSAEKYAKVNWADHIDLKTGRPVENPEARANQGDFVMYPGAGGAHSSEAMSFDPLTRLVYIPTIESAWVYNDRGVDRDHWKPQPGMVLSTGMSQLAPTTPLPPPTSALLAWDPINRKAVWSVPTPGIFNGGITSTGGNLVFQGRADGRFTAFSADSGKPAWSWEAQAGMMGAPITYLAGGKQYVTIVAGYGGQGSMVGGALGWDFATQPRRVLTFALDGATTLPPSEPQLVKVIDDPSFQIDSAKAASGAHIYGDHCLFCHGIGAIGGGGAPDLRASQVVLSTAAFTRVLHDGSLRAAGMPKFGEFSADEVADLQNYIRQAARQSTAAR
jgi:quinohemoprotein ethanol dehydrogenase